MDEYERAAFELKTLVENVSEEDYTRIADAETKDADCHSIQTMMNHVVHAGYGYANAIRRKFSMPHEPLGDERPQISQAEIGAEIDKVLAYTVETLDGRWEMSYEEMNKTLDRRPGEFSRKYRTTARTRRSAHFASSPSGRKIFTEISKLNL